jgi:hypothetical protein
MMFCTKHTDQHEDGWLNYFVVFGDECAPWNADNANCVQCASESDADKLIRLVTRVPVIVPNGACADEMNAKHGEGYGVDWAYSASLPMRQMVSVNDGVPPDGEIVTVYVDRYGYHPNYFGQSSRKNGEWTKHEGAWQRISHWESMPPIPRPSKPSANQ